MAVPLPSYPEQSQATTALVLGILGIVCCGFLGIAAWVIAKNELEAIASGRRDPINEGTAKAARVVGIVATALLIVPAFIFILAGVGSITVPFFST
jgi:TRAP-type C4-dicarboxylate transport system permease small subunit